MDELVRGVEEELSSGDALDRLHAAVLLADQVSALADGLVGHFVEAARSEGCSWAQIGSELGVSKQAAQQRFVTRPIAGLTARMPSLAVTGRGKARRGFFSRFTAPAREAITAAQEEARGLGHDEVRTEHLVLSLIADPDARPARALAVLGLDAAAVRAEILDRVGPGSDTSEKSPPFAPGTKKALELALREGLQADTKIVAPEHVLLGVLREGEGLGSQVLAALGAGLDAVREALAASR